MIAAGANTMPHSTVRQSLSTGRWRTARFHTSPAAAGFGGNGD
jgi:hypothetical protein